MLLYLRRRKTGETILKAGGRWDRLDRQYVDQTPERETIIDLEESQVPFVRWFQDWLMAFREGYKRETSLAVAGGDRRGGKTFSLLCCTVATCIEVPELDHSSLIGWVVSVNYQERDEIDKTIREYVPPAWYHYRKAPEFRYQFVNGSTLRNVSADDPDTLKRGRVDVILYNEAQKMSVSALSNGVMGTADKGGIALLASNPPQKQRGEWLFELKEAIDEGRISGAKFFGFSSKDNERIDQSARSRVGGILKIIDPRASQADDEGAWLPVGDRAYPKYNRRLLTKEIPTVERGDITRDITAEYMKKRAGRPYEFVAGVDFQGTPWHAGAVFKIFGTMERPIYWAVDEIIAEQSTEDDFINDAEERGYTPENLLWIGDSSGCWQDGKHSTARTGRASFDFFKQRRWHILPPQLKKSTKGEWPRNPNVADRLGLLMKLMSDVRIMVDPSTCVHLNEAFKECPLKSFGGGRRLPSGRYAHITDAAGYLLWYLEPRPKPHRKGTPDMSGFASINVRQAGVKIY